MRSAEEEKRVRQMFALLNKANITDRNDRLTLAAGILATPMVTSTDALDGIAVQAIVDTLDYWKRIGELPQRCAAMIADFRTPPVQPVAAPEPIPVVDERPLKMNDARGNPIIRVQFEPAGPIYTYVWAGKDTVQVGDRVITPGPRYQDQPSAAVVCALGSDYSGTMTVLTKKARD